MTAAVLDVTLTTVRTSCSYCGVGCGLVLDVEADETGRRRVVRSTGDTEHPANRGRLCTKGSTTAEMLAAPGRLATALQRDGRHSEPQPVDVDAAISHTARELRRLLDEHGPDAVSFYVSGQMSIEAQYLANKLAKGFIGTNQIESNSRLCMASAGTGYKLSLGSDGPPGSYDDLDHADVFFVIGANMADCHPILFLRMMDRIHTAGAKLIVVDPRRNATADKADLFLQIKPGTDLALLNGLLHLLVAESHTDPAFISEFTEGWEVMTDFLADYPPDRVSAITGIPEAAIRTAARWIGDAGNWMSMWTMGLNQSTHGTWHTNALCNLHLATGAICRPGSGPFSLTGQPNAMGGREMGYMGPGLPGQRTVAVEQDRAFIEKLWAIPTGTLRTDFGTGTIDLFSRIADGEIKACWIMCTNPVASVGNRKTVIAGLEAAELVITQDAFADTETNAYADVVLPAAMWAESEGVTVNSERTLTLSQRAADPPGQALPDWQLIARVACEMGFAAAFSYTCAEEVFDEIRQTWNPKTGYDLRGVSYDRLRESPVQWPCPTGDGDGRNPIRYLNDGVSQRLLARPDGSTPRLAFATASGRAVFFPRPHMPAAEMPDEQFPFVLNTGRVQHQWHTLTKTGKVAKLNKLNPGPFVELHPADASGLDISEGDMVEVASRRGRALLPAVITDRVRSGNCFAPFHWNDLFGEYLSINAVTNDAVDPLSFQPELKVCAVSLTRVAAASAARIARSAEGAAPEDTSTRPLDTIVRATRGSGDDSSPFGALAGSLGLTEIARPAFTDGERTYLAGFLAALEASAGLDPRVLPVLPPHAPFDPARALWVNGALAGVFSRQARSEFGGGSTPAQREVLVLWASQTGGAEEVAARVHRRLADEGAAVTLRCMADQAKQPIPSGTDLLLVTSTFGDGEPPDNGAAMWRALVDPAAAALNGVRFAVLAFGDSSYRDFCGHGRRMDERLEELGAARLLRRVDCDSGNAGAVGPWLDQVLVALAEAPPAPRTAAATVQSPAAPAPAELAAAPTTTARLIGNQLLSGPGSDKEVRYFTLDLAGSGLTYETGDILAVTPNNSESLVHEWLTATGVDADELVDVPCVGPTPFAEALRSHFEIAKPNADLLRFVADRSHDRQMRVMLEPAGRMQLENWLYGRQAVDVVSEFEAVRHGVQAQEWADLLKPLVQRRYSIASTPDATPDLVELLVSVVRYESPGRRQRAGVCSAFLAETPLGQDIPVEIHPARYFRPAPNVAIPMIMIGPGTGLAPFLGFLNERRLHGESGRNWLFFGEQREATDFYFRDELTAMHEVGLLTRLDVAFSRDQRAKIYVQDRMREHGAELWRWLQGGAHVYVCGDASRMSKDVDDALREIVAHHGSMSQEDAAEYVRQLAADNRYLRHVY